MNLDSIGKCSLFSCTTQKCSCSKLTILRFITETETLSSQTLKRTSEFKMTETTKQTNVIESKKKQQQQFTPVFRVLSISE